MSQVVQLAPPTRRSVERRRPTRAGRSYFLRTFGCQMNEHDSERVAGLFEADGMVRARSLDEADVVFVNTCTIRENADNRMYGNLGQLKQLKDAQSGRMLIVGGCAAQKDRELVRERAPWVDVVLGTHNLHRVVDLLDQAEEWGPVTEIVDALDTMPSELPVRRESPYSAWVTIQIGCNNTCTFCIVPAVRGPEISRRPGDIIREIEQLASEGVIEVTLLGQNVDTYGRDLAIDGRRRPIFAQLLARVGEVDGIRRIRFTSPHPNDFRRDVAEAMAGTEAVCEQLHFPLQSGSDRILAAMHRGYKARKFLNRLAMAREVIPDLTVSTDVIVGFPGETEDDFRKTLEVVEEARFDQAYMFLFSARPGTRAAAMTDRFVPDSVAKERFGRLVELQTRIGSERNRRHVGRRMEVLVEGPSKRDPSVATTRSRGNKIVHVEGEFAPGSLMDVTIERAGAHYLVGAPV
ncbi:MAG: tRNA (N6-isopentenyl adenosine(37)-C2)-methylthiotransferase MiaB [bacterium]|nr:tRNA (N6-isopentenyl adenosine(37)-C2)-methylthiotransferase MiaB [bacterium]MDE0351560.1 tRNA (N6-isopentenyl adenosine(37)-C2)-methylthiotransferase MiaB [bacterium]